MGLLEISRRTVWESTYRMSAKVPVQVSDERKDRRRVLRARMYQRWRIRVPDSDLPVEFCATRDVSRSGLYFVTSSTHYIIGMKVCVVRNFDADDQMSVEEAGEVVRVTRLKDNKRGVGIHISTH
jgi:hypothetical protein